ncbi:hypothetical protein QQF64_028038, partial [Cirrhinus molitorella]
PIGWACVIVFLQILRVVMKFTDEDFIFLHFDQATAKWLHSCQNIVKSKQTPASRLHQNQKTTEMHELKPLKIEDQEEDSQT